MILFVADNNGFSFLKSIVVIFRRVVYKSKVTLLIITNTIITTFINKHEPVIVNLLISSTVYPPQPVFIVNKWEQSKVQISIIADSLVTTSIRYSTKLIYNG